MNDNKRTENFNLIREKLESQGYCAEQCTISIVKANVMAFVTAGPVAALCCVLFFYTKNGGEIKFSILGLLLFYTFMLVSISVHELLHGLTWSLYCKNGWKSIHLGVMWKKLTPYCCCMESLSFGQYILGGLMPFIVLGLGIFVVSFITNSIFLLILSIFNIIAAGGDTTIAVMLLKHKNAFIIDHPTKCGFWAFSKEM
ncbi:MAG: hypothetical protein ACI8WT_004525 [Clostridium sp.]|jgi:hypothetical protein